MPEADKDITKKQEDFYAVVSSIVKFIEKADNMDNLNSERTGFQYENSK